jgi:hypothetical protein
MQHEGVGAWSTDGKEPRGSHLPRYPVQPSNEALEQTRSALVTAAAALAAQRRCSTGKTGAGA